MTVIVSCIIVPYGRLYTVMVSEYCRAQSVGLNSFSFYKSSIVSFVVPPRNTANTSANMLPFTITITGKTYCIYTNYILQ